MVFFIYICCSAWARRFTPSSRRSAGYIAKHSRIHPACGSSSFPSFSLSVSTVENRWPGLKETPSSLARGSRALAVIPVGSRHHTKYPPLQLLVKAYFLSHEKHKTLHANRVIADGYLGACTISSAGHSFRRAARSALHRESYTSRKRVRWRSTSPFPINCSATCCFVLRS
jgi:hypothetical protein